jgi:amino acid transporter
VFDLGVLAHRGAAALPATSFAPGTVFSGAVGLALMLGFTSFLGFESAALYGEETADPRRSIPRARRRRRARPGRPAGQCLTAG